MRKIFLQVRDGKDLPKWNPFIGTKIEIYGMDAIILLSRGAAPWPTLQTDIGPPSHSAPVSAKLDISSFFQLPHLFTCAFC